MNTESLLLHFCKYVYYTGAGNYWYENVYTESILYKIYTFLSFSLYTCLVLLEILAALFGSFPDVEKNSAVMFASIHSIVLIKMYLFLYHKKSVRRLNYEMSKVGAEMEANDVMARQYKKTRVGVILYIISVYLSLGSYGVESTRKSIVENAPFYTVVTYLPYYEDDSHLASFFRIFFYITWLYMMLPMISADGMPITHLIIMSFKFVTLRHYYEKTRVDHEKGISTLSEWEATEKLRSRCVDGILMHQKLLSLTEELHRVFGVIMSLQVCESSAVAVLLLLRLALSPHLDLTNAVMTYTFVGSLFLLLALYLWNAGEVTYNAFEVSNAIFYCGWHLTRHTWSRSRRDICRIVLISCAQAQKPLILKAFGIQDLSYETFVSVAKATYSVFAVFYKKGD